MMSIALFAADTSDGGTEFENRYGRERLLQPIDDFGSCGREAAGRPAERLAQRAGNHVDVVEHAEFLGRAAAAGAKMAGAVAIVDADNRVVLVGQLADVRQLRQVAVHAEDAVGEDHLESAVLGLFELGLQIGHVVVLVAEALRLAQTDAVDDAGVVQLVAQDRVLLAEQWFEQPAVGVEAGDVEDRVFLAEEVGDRLFELPVRLLRAADEADAGKTIAPLLQALVGACTISG